MFKLLLMVVGFGLCAANIFAQWKEPQIQDSTRFSPQLPSSQPLGTTTPGEYPFSPEQDRRFYQALSEYVSVVVRFRYDVKETTT